MGDYWYNFFLEMAYSQYDIYYVCILFLMSGAVIALLQGNISAFSYSSGKLEPLFLILLTLLMFLFIQRCGMVQFGGFDLSVPIDIGWRIIQGQRPYVDFPVTFPPGFIIGCGAAFRWFGLNFESLVLIAAVYACFTFVWIYALLRELSLIHI